MQPAEKVEARWTEITDLLRPATEFRLHRLINETKAELSKVSPHDSVPLHTFLSSAYGRLERKSEAYQHARSAATIAKDSRLAIHNMGAMALSMGYLDEAIELFARAVDMPSEDVNFLGEDLCLYGNLAMALEKFGDHDGATSAFNNAVTSANLREPNDLFVLACNAAAIGLNVEAVELLARALSRKLDRPLSGDALDFCLRTVPDVETALDQPMARPLRMLVTRLAALSPELASANRRAASLPLKQPTQESETQRLEVAADMAPYAEHASMTAMRKE